MRQVEAAPIGMIPEIGFCLYQLLFCAVTVQIVIGGAFERGRIVPSLIFAFLWATIVYCPVACWTWNANGWLYNLPSLDYAGGGPVHIASGWAALAYAFVLGKRKHKDEKSHSKPHNPTLVFLGTVLIWFGWFGTSFAIENLRLTLTNLCRIQWRLNAQRLHSLPLRRLQHERSRQLRRHRMGRRRHDPH